MTQLNNDEPYHANNEISLNYLLIKMNEWYRYLTSKWAVILIAAILGGVIGLLYSFNKKPTYKAEISFALEDDKGSGGGGLGAAMGLASQFGLDLGGGGGGVFSGDNIVELLKSRSMIEKAMLSPVTIAGKQQTLADLYISFNHLDKNLLDKNGNRINFPLNADRSKYSLQQDSVMGTFYRVISKKILSVEKPDKKLSIINLTVNSNNELFSKYFAEALANTVSNFYIETKTKKSVQNVNILQHQTDSVRRELNAAINGVAMSADVNPNPNPALQILRAPSLRRQVDVQANQAILTQLVANLELSKVSLRKETPLIQFIDKPILPLEKDELSKTKAFLFGAIVLGFIATVFLIMKKLLVSIFS